MVGLYGKHPLAGDFVQHNASAEVVRALDGWLANAVAKSQRLLGDGEHACHWEQAFSALPPSPFLLNHTAERCIFGVLVPSYDQAGRQFPLVIFAEISRDLLAGRLASLPHERFLVEIVTTLEANHDLPLASLRDAVGALAPPVAASLDEALERHEILVGEARVVDVFEELLPGHRPRYWGRAAQAVRDAGRNAPRAPGASYGIRCPLGFQPTTHVAMWLDLLQGHLGHGAAPTALWNRHTALVYGGQAPPQALAALLDPGWQDDGLVDLRALSTVSDSAAAGFPLDQAVSELLRAGRSR